MHEDDALKFFDEHLSVKNSAGSVVLQPALIATLYFDQSFTHAARAAVVECCEYYIGLCGSSLRWAWNPMARRMQSMQRIGDKEGLSPREWLDQGDEDKNWAVIYHGAAHQRGASSYLFDALGSNRTQRLLGFVKIAFPILWFTEHGGRMVDVVTHMCNKLKPVSGYSGIGIIESPDLATSVDYEPIVYQIAQRFPGLEVDYPESHCMYLRDGIKGVNWLTVLGEGWVSKLGGAAAIRSAVMGMDSRFAVHDVDGGIIIQAGERPSLGDMDRGVWPELYTQLAAYLKPIRMSRHRPFQHGSPADQPGTLRFDKERSEAWLRRFDGR